MLSEAPLGGVQALPGRDRQGGAAGPRHPPCAGRLRDAQDGDDPRLAGAPSPYHLHFTPTSGSWLNQVERWFAEITRQQIRRGTHRSTQALETAIKEDLAVYNEDPRPFVWTKTAEQILDSLKRYCSRIGGRAGARGRAGAGPPHRSVGRARISPDRATRPHAIPSAARTLEEPARAASCGPNAPTASPRRRRVRLSPPFGVPVGYRPLGSRRPARSGHERSRSASSLGRCRAVSFRHRPPLVDLLVRGSGGP